MTMTLQQARITLSSFVAISGADEVDSAQLKTPSADVVDTYTAPSSSETGASANRATLAFIHEVSLSSLESHHIDLSSLDDRFAGTFTMASVKVFWLRNNGATDLQVVSTLAILPGTFVVKSGGTFCVSSPSAGHAVVNGVSDMIDVNNASGAGSVQMILLGS